MKTKKVIYSILFILIVSCSEKDNLDYNKLSKINNKYFVKKETAIYIAEHFNFFTSNNPNSKNSTNLSIKNITSINDNNKNPAYYIINYNNDAGYLVLSADYRQEAILGFGENGNFLTSNIPPQLNYIIEEQTSEIEFIRENEVDSIEQVPEDSWSMFTLPPEDQPIPIDPECEGQYSYEYTKGPLLTTQWGQNGGGTVPYNNFCPIPNGCSYKAPTGCVATAMSQIMYYHKWPNTYDWTQMQNGNTSSAECARLMRDAGISVNMNYDCYSSGAYSKDVEKALENDFGYSTSTSYETYYSGPMQTEIDSYRPVYLSAGGHAWVCDGYRYYFSGCTGSIWPHMNWGWNGAYNDYFGFNNWNPSSYSFNSNRKMVKVRK
jgi:hypothetical protein